VVLREWTDFYSPGRGALGLRQPRALRSGSLSTLRQNPMRPLLPPRSPSTRDHTCRIVGRRALRLSTVDASSSSIHRGGAWPFYSPALTSVRDRWERIACFPVKIDLGTVSL